MFGFSGLFMSGESTYVSANDGILVEWTNSSISEKIEQREKMVKMELYSTKVEAYYEAITKKKKQRRK